MPYVFVSPELHDAISAEFENTPVREALETLVMHSIKGSSVAPSETRAHTPQHEPRQWEQQGPTLFAEESASFPRGNSRWSYSSMSSQTRQNPAQQTVSHITNHQPIANNLQHGTPRALESSLEQEQEIEDLRHTLQQKAALAHALELALTNERRKHENLEREVQDLRDRLLDAADLSQEAATLKARLIRLEESENEARALRSKLAEIQMRTTHVPSIQPSPPTPAAPEPPPSIAVPTRTSPTTSPAIEPKQSLAPPVPRLDLESDDDAKALSPSRKSTMSPRTRSFRGPFKRRGSASKQAPEAQSEEVKLTPRSEKRQATPTPTITLPLARRNSVTLPLVVVAFFFGLFVARLVFGKCDALEESSKSTRSLWPLYVTVTSLVVIVGFVIRFFTREWRGLQSYAAAHEQTVGEMLMPFLLYRVDYWFSTTSSFKPLVLFFLNVLLILIGGMLYFVVKGDSLGASLWSAWLFIIDTGALGDESEMGGAAVALMQTIGGMLVFALVIGITSDAISEKFDSLKMGKAMVMETNHSLILGWSDKTIPYIKEIALANESEGGGVIVILSENPKAETENAITMSGVDLKGSTVVVRTGNPSEAHYLLHVSALHARSIVVMSPVDISPQEADMWSLRVVLCLTGIGYHNGHVVAEVRDIDNIHLFNIISGTEIEPIVAHDFIGRLIVQSSRQSGLAEVLGRLFGFEGCEFYLERWPDLEGCTWHDVFFRFADAVPIGILTSDNRTILLPDTNFVLQDGDAVIVLAEDNDSYKPAAAPKYDFTKPLPELSAGAHHLSQKHVENVLLLGWRRDLADIFVEVDNNCLPGSTLTVMAGVPLEARDSKLTENGRPRHNLVNCTVKHVVGNITVRRDLDALPIEAYTSVLILTDEEYEADMAAADSRTLTASLLIHDIREKRRCNQDCTVTSEVLDPRTRSLLALAKVTDYVMSNEVVSAAMAMVSERREISGILRELLSTNGCELYLRGARHYLSTGQSEYLSFWDVAQRVLLYNKAVLLGYDRDGTLELNPPHKDVPVNWKPSDRLIILARSSTSAKR
eukprot:TRINITY_DN3486_c0_g1_i1.p1 TRINITY_DN3486_c0_g1~~TRINITY_DN3486_c0_g1_i1.p1  ORF type:complete len:1047 (-),score=166.69 TRINITY_DN3486_c0_g1_i1:35-3175(-)